MLSDAEADARVRRPAMFCGNTAMTKAHMFLRQVQENSRGHKPCGATFLPVLRSAEILAWGSYLKRQIQDSIARQRQLRREVCGITSPHQVASKA